MAAKPEIIRARIDRRAAVQLARLVREGFFKDSSEALAVAISEFLERRKVSRLKKALREDVEWGLRAA